MPGFVLPDVTSACFQPFLRFYCFLVNLFFLFFGFFQRKGCRIDLFVARGFFFLRLAVFSRCAFTGFFPRLFCFLRRCFFCRRFSLFRFSRCFLFGVLTFCAGQFSQLFLSRYAGVDRCFILFSFGIVSFRQFIIGSIRGHGCNDARYLELVLVVDSQLNNPVIAGIADIQVLPVNKEALRFSEGLVVQIRQAQ